MELVLALPGGEDGPKVEELFHLMGGQGPVPLPSWSLKEMDFCRELFKPVVHGCLEPAVSAGLLPQALILCSQDQPCLLRVITITVDVH